MAQRIVLDEESIKKEFVRQNAELTEKTVKSAKKELLTKSRRIEELTRMIQAVYEDKVNGKMPELFSYANTSENIWTNFSIPPRKEKR